MPDGKEHNTQPLQAIAGSPPDLFAPPPGCAYHPRCPQAMQVCARQSPSMFENGSSGHYAHCWLQHPACPKPAAES